MAAVAVARSRKLENRRGPGRGSGVLMTVGKRSSVPIKQEMPRREAAQNAIRKMVKIGPQADQWRLPGRKERFGFARCAGLLSSPRSTFRPDRGMCTPHLEQ